MASTRLKRPLAFSKALPLTLTLYWLSCTHTGAPMVTPVSKGVLSSSRAKLLADTLVESMASLKLTLKSTLSSRVWPPAATLVPRTTLLSTGATVSTSKAGEPAALPGLPSASV